MLHLFAPYFPCCDNSCSRIWNAIPFWIRCSIVSVGMLSTAAFAASMLARFFVTEATTRGLFFAALAPVATLDTFAMVAFCQSDRETPETAASHLPESKAALIPARILSFFAAAFWPGAVLTR